MPAATDSLARPAARPLRPLPIRRWVRRARRSPVAWWSCAAAVAALAFTRVAALDDDAAARRQAWGTPVPVAVAVVDLAPGAVVGPDDVAIEEWPEAMLPVGTQPDAPVGRTVTARVVAGEALLAARLAPEGLSGIAALIPDDHRAVAVPSAGGGFGTEAPPLAVGDRVDVLATFDVLTDEGSATEPTGAVAEAALVVDVGDSSVTVAVREVDAPRVAFAAARGTITLALVGAR